MHHVFERGANPQLTEYQKQTHRGVDAVRREEEALQRRAAAVEAARQKRDEEEAELRRRTRG